MTLTQDVVGLADRTPASRNRVVDLLRALSIGVVVLGHWLMAAVYLDAEGDLRRADLLGMEPWLHPVTWLLQVMPVFFLVGGYANALSWRGAQGRGSSYAGWLRTRLRRLMLPVLPLMVFWLMAAPLGVNLGASPALIRTASQASLVPTWFLAAYVVVVGLAPLTLRLWQRLRWGSVLLGLTAAAMVDLLSLTLDLPALGFVNYLLVWGTVHQLGYAWLDGALPGTARRLGLAAVGLSGLLLLTVLGPYAVSMVGVEGYGINNAYPTRVTLGFLGLLQAGLVLALEPILRRVTARRAVWVGTVFVNARIMTIYLWHLSALGFVVAASLAAGGLGLGLGLEPTTAEWWRSRPLWFGALALVTTLLVALLGRFETPRPDDRPAPPAWLPVLALIGSCAGLGLMADLGLATGDGQVRWFLPLVPILALVAGGVVRLPRGRRPSRLPGGRRGGAHGGHGWDRVRPPA